MNRMDDRSFSHLDLHYTVQGMIVWNTSFGHTEKGIMRGRSNQKRSDVDRPCLLSITVTEIKNYAIPFHCDACMEPNSGIIVDPIAVNKPFRLYSLILPSGQVQPQLFLRRIKKPIEKSL